MSITMLDYIQATAPTLTENLNNSKQITQTLVNEYVNNNYNGITIVACGSSYNGSMCARYFLMKYLKADVNLINPFTFVNHEHNFENKMMVFVSQSGCSTNTIECLKLMKNEGKRSVALVGRDDCDMKQIADVTVNWMCGEEKIGFVTRGLTSLAFYWMLFALEASLVKGYINQQEYNSAKEELAKAIELNHNYIEETIDKFNLNKEALTTYKRVYVLASGACLGVAKEAALKISETSCKMGLDVEIEEYIHGYNYSSDPDCLTLIIDNDGHSSSRRIIDIAKANPAITERTFVLTDSNEIDEQHAFRSNGSTSWEVMPIYKLSCLQTLAYLMADNTNKFQPYPGVIKFKEDSSVASKSRSNLYMDVKEFNK